MFKDNSANFSSTSEKMECLMAENDALRQRNDEQQKIIATLKKRLGAAETTIKDLKGEIEHQYRQRQICEAQIDIVKMIFGKGA